MNILLVEDSGPAVYYLRESLEEQHTVFLAQNISRAKTYWEDETIDIDCIIVDLNMPPTGLTEEEKVETQGGLFSGWVWLKNYVFVVDKEIKERTIILTAYIREFKRKLEMDKVGPKELGGVRVVSKNPIVSYDPEQTKKVLMHVKEIAKGLEG